ncbi:hypothetical protein PMAYCL1PPCAC_15192, partial [Pristionchus mayeri]
SIINFYLTLRAEKNITFITVLLQLRVNGKRGMILVDEASGGLEASLLEGATEVLATEPASLKNVGGLASSRVGVVKAAGCRVHVCAELLGVLAELVGEVAHACLKVGRGLGHVLHALELVEGLLESSVTKEIERLVRLNVVVGFRSSGTVLGEEVVEGHAAVVLSSQALVEVSASIAEVEDVVDALVSVVVNRLGEVEGVLPVKSSVESEDVVELGLASLHVVRDADCGVVLLGGRLGVLDGEFGGLLGQANRCDEL